MKVKIQDVQTVQPPYTRKTEDIIPLVEFWLAEEDERYRRKAIKIFEGAQVNQRYSIMPPESVFSNLTFEERNIIYSQQAQKIASEALQKSLINSGWEASSLDYIITVSCTGIMIPSLDAYLINEVGLKQSVVRLPVTEMGCVAGVSAMIYASQFLQANPEKRAAIVAFEAPTATFLKEDTSMTNIVSSAIFGDGCACVLMSSEEMATGPEVVGSEMYHFYNQTHMMGFDLTNKGLKMVLDEAVPETITEHFPSILHPFLQKFDLQIEDLTHLVFHPGGKKIVQTVEELFKDIGKDISSTKKVLREFGNMSSATVLYVLKDIIEKEPKANEFGLMLSFGPGFTAQRLLLKW
ncbi:MAG: type III polyketide synthase [Flavobacteriaceae bacterium]|nr:type III polyketide synthase [Flavobacteriaceae bacterium]